MKRKLPGGRKSTKRYEKHQKTLSEQRERDSAQPKEKTDTHQRTSKESVPPVKIDREQAAGQMLSEVHVVDTNKETPESTAKLASECQEEKMEVDKDLDLKIPSYDPVPKYLIDLKLTLPQKLAKSSSMPNLEDDPQAAQKPPSSSGSSSGSECSSNSQQVKRVNKMK